MKNYLLFATVALLSPVGALATEGFPFPRKPLPVAEHNWTQWTIEVKTDNPKHTLYITYDARIDSNVIALTLENETGIAPGDQKWIWHTEDKIRELKLEDADWMKLGQQANKGAFMTLIAISGQKAQKPSEKSVCMIS